MPDFQKYKKIDENPSFYGQNRGCRESMDL
jgi:hypothetical protein